MSAYLDRPLRTLREARADIAATQDYIYHNCVEQSIGWFQAHGWDLVYLYADCGVPMAKMRHVDIPEDDEE